VNSHTRRIARVEEALDAEAQEHERRCICELVIIEGGQPTPEQTAIIARNAMCKAHTRDITPPVSVVEVPPRPAHMRTP
jgi:hypothetical protein